MENLAGYEEETPEEEGKAEIVHRCFQVWDFRVLLCFSNTFFCILLCMRMRSQVAALCAARGEGDGGVCKLF